MASTLSECPEPLSAKFKESFAYTTIKDRLPVILTKVIDSVYRERNVISTSYGLESTEVTKVIIGRLSELRNEMVTNKPILPLKSDGSDVSLWNNYLDYQYNLYGFEPAWFDSPWLYVECYLYRRIKEAFELSGILRDYDPFKQQKETAFLSSLPAVITLSCAAQDAIRKCSTRDESIMFDYFVKFVEVSLWGNKCDLSISGGSDNYQSTDPLSQLDDMRPNILVNDVEALWNILTSANEKHSGSVTVDIVLDNAGFELFADFCLLEFLHAVKLINKVRFYVKIMPWYVSDTMASDINWMLNTMVSNSEEILVNLGQLWSDKFETGIWSIESEAYWTLPHDFSDMKAVDPALYSKLSKSDIIIFKGDLNYRKLTGDLTWDPTTPFCSALRGFLPAPLCSLRTIKNDVITALKPGVKEEMDKLNSGWMFYGNYAVIQCAST